ncbi:polycomb group RING finger protein 3-like [Oculina patagonica]
MLGVDSLGKDFGNMQKRIKLPVTTLNQHIICKLCNGYLVDAATITECLHTFCKSCLVRHIELVNRCPTCNSLIHESQPLYNIRLDRTMQDIVYKLLPKVEREEKRRERKFYKDRGIPYPDPKALVSQPLHAVARPSKAIKKEKTVTPKTSKTTVTKSSHRTDEQISLQLETFLDGNNTLQIEPLQKKFIRLSTKVTVGLIQRFLASKLHLESENMVGILYDKTEMGRDLTLKYISDNLSPQKEHSAPLILHYRAMDVRFTR